MATSAVNGSTAEMNGSSAKAMGATAQQQGRAPIPAKAQDGQRKENDEAQRRPPQPKAWTSGVNPITQRSNTPLGSNGAIVKPQPKSSSQDSKSLDKTLLDRQASFVSTGVGLECNIITRTGETFTGLFAGSQKLGDDYKLLFKMVRATSGGSSNETINGTSMSSSEYLGVGSEHSMVFSCNALVSIDVPEAPVLPGAATPNGASSSFRTDTDISGAGAGRERSFQRWEAPSEKGAVSLSLDSTGDWDQFKANEEKFGLKSNYDENLYTTTIDRSNPLYAMREREAARIAREIEGDTSGNAHMREERGHWDEGVDEEEKYSGVRRGDQDFASLQSNQPNRYMPPARRAQVSSTATAEGPIDPAIISSQIARPDAGELPKADTKADPKPSAEAEQASEPKLKAKADSKSSANPKDLKPLRQPGASRATATENVESELLDSFKQFAASEKIKVQDHKRSRASADKAVKLNDLMKFSQNFKLLTPVPNDLVPILARDEGKQKEIVQKALKNCDESKTTKAPMMDPKTQRPLAAARLDKEAMGADAGSHSRARHDGAGHAASHAKDRPHQGREMLPNRPPQMGLSARLADSHKLHKAGMMAAVPQPLPIQETRNMSGRSSAHPSALPSPQKASSLRGPPSATSSKFNVKATEFKPNPSASTFKPVATPMATTAASSPRSGSVTRNISPSGAQPKFFGDKTKFGKHGERPDPISLVAPKKPSEQSKDDLSDASKSSALPAQNGGFQWPYKTLPTWSPPEEGENAEPEVKYTEAFDKLRFGRQTSSHGKVSPVNPAAHHHQLPFHLQNGPNAVPQVQTPQPLPQQMNHQPHHLHHGPHYDDHHQRPAMPNMQGYPAASPRLQNSNVAYHSPMPPHAQLAYGQPLQYVMHGTPPMNGRQFSGGPQMMPVPGGHLAPMMVQQQSSGGYLPQPMAVQYNPQMPMYASPAPPMYATPSQPPSGYPSPGRGAPMMMHQGSHQGHNQPVYAPTGHFVHPMYAQHPPAHMANIRAGFGSPQPHYQQNHYPQHQFPHQPHRTPSNGYVQPHQVHHPHGVSQQGPPPSAAPAEMGDEAK